jgi:hypothetical protein
MADNHQFQREAVHEVTAKKTLYSMTWRQYLTQIHAAFMSHFKGLNRDLQTLIHVSSRASCARKAWRVARLGHIRLSK